ncbi:MAG: chorismate synthase [Crocinitomicaceae bacterium]|nr:chorismate synthase [Crocinitomicaceae bacterium]
MNSFGRNFRINVFGESHGAIMGVTLDGVPPGIDINIEDFQEDIERRKPGKKGTTPRVESDQPRFVSGVFNGKTTGAPLTMLFENSNTRSEDYAKTREYYRPGHADFVASQKFKGFEDYRGGGHFSGRLTILIVCAGVIAKKILGLPIEAKLIEIAGESDLDKGLQKGIDAKDSVGGIVECRVNQIPVGWGEPFFDSVESVLAHAMFAIPAIKGVEFGAGFGATKMFGSEHNDNIIDEKGKTDTNNAGGIVGGITNGNEIVFRVAVKPTSSIGKTQETWNHETHQIGEFSVKGRHDLCIALRVPVVVEAMTAISLLDLKMQAGR